MPSAHLTNKSVCLPLSVHVRPMNKSDRPKVRHIDRLSFEHPWQVEEWQLHINQPPCYFMVAVRQQNILGFMVYYYYPEFPELEIINFAVHPDYRRHRVGTAMVERLMSKLKPPAITTIKLIIRETNLDGQLFFKYHGFRWTKTLHRFWEDSEEDSYLMEYCAPAPILC